MQKTDVQTQTRQETKQATAPKTEIVRPKDWEINLLNSDQVSFEAISHVLAVALNIAADQAMLICFKANNEGKAPVFKGARDLAERYFILLQNTKTQLAVGKHPGMGYDYIDFEVLECE